MIETILSGLKDQLAGDLQQKAGVQGNMLDDILKVTGKVASKEVSKEMLSGNLDAVMNLFSDKSNNAQASSLQDNIMQGMITNFVQKLGLSKETAVQATRIIIPALMNMITKKNNETPSNDPSPLTDLFDLKGQGDSNPLGGLIGKTLGGFFGKK